MCPTFHLHHRPPPPPPPLHHLHHHHHLPRPRPHRASTTTRHYLSRSGRTRAQVQAQECRNGVHHKAQHHSIWNGPQLRLQHPNRPPRLHLPRRWPQLRTQLSQQEPGHLQQVLLQQQQPRKKQQLQQRNRQRQQKNRPQQQKSRPQQLKNRQQQQQRNRQQQPLQQEEEEVALEVAALDNFCYPKIFLHLNCFSSAS